MKTTLYLSYDGLTDPLGQSQIIPYIIGIKRQLNCKITIISFEKSSNFSKNIKEIEKIIEKNTINWIPIKYTKKPPVISTLWDLYKLKISVKRLNKKGVDLIHCRSYITAFIAHYFKRKYKVPFIFDMRGFYADERVDGKIWKQNNLFYKYIYNYFKKKEKLFIKESDHIVSLTKAGKQEIESWKVQNQPPITVIPCCTDEDLFKKENSKPIRKNLGIDADDFVISYVGSIGSWYMLDEMLDFFKELKKKKSNSKFLFITRDNPRLILNKVIEKNIDINNIKIQSSTREMMPSYIKASDYSIFFILPVFSKRASSPTKMGEIMNLGVPVICNSGVGDVKEIMNKCMPELLIKNFKKEEFERVINLIISDFKPEITKIISTSNEYYSLKKGVKKYKDIYESILNKS